MKRLYKQHMKIAINGTFWNKPTTGSGQYVRALVSTLASIAPENEYIVILSSAVNPPSEYIPHVTFQSQYASSERLHENLGKVLFEQVGFVKACQNERIDLAHVPYFGSPLFPRTRTVVTIHDLIPMVRSMPLYRGSLLVRAYTQLAALSAHSADVIIADSEWSKRDIVQHLQIDESRVRVVHLAAEARYQPIDPNQADPVRQKYSLPQKYLLYLGGYDQRKNVSVILHAFARLRDLYDAGYRLVLAGVMLVTDSEFFPNPRRIARAANLPDDAMVYLGKVDEADKPALYSLASAFVFPSIYEGFGLPVLEAMACGVPVACSNASSLPEVAGAAAITVDPKNIDAWVDAIRTVLQNPLRRAEMSLHGMKQARKFSWTRTTEETLQVFRAARGR